MNLARGVLQLVSQWAWHVPTSLCTTPPSNVMVSCCEGNNKKRERMACRGGMRKGKWLQAGRQSGYLKHLGRWNFSNTWPINKAPCFLFVVAAVVAKQKLKKAKQKNKKRWNWKQLRTQPTSSCWGVKCVFYRVWWVQTEWQRGGEGFPTTAIGKFVGYMMHMMMPK